MIKSPKGGNVYRTPGQRVKPSEVINGYGVGPTMTGRLEGDGIPDVLKSAQQKLSSAVSKVKESVSDAASDLKSGYYGLKHIKEDAGEHKFTEGMLIDKIRDLNDEINVMKEWYRRNKVIMPVIGDGMISKLVNDYSNRQAEKHGTRAAQLQGEYRKLSLYRDALRAGMKAVVRGTKPEPSEDIEEVRYEPAVVEQVRVRSPEWVGFGPRQTYGRKSLHGMMSPISLKSCA